MGIAERLDMMRSVVDQGFDAVIATTAELEAPGPRITYVNEAFCRMSGYRRDELIGASPRLFQGPGTDRAELDRMRACLAAGETFTGCVVNYRKDGSPYLLECKALPLPGASGRPEAYVAIQRDLTPQARAERFGQTLLDSLGEGVFGIDTAGDFTFLNPRALALLGYDDECELLGRNSHETIHVAPDGSAHDGGACPVHWVMRTGESLDAWEDRFYRADGSGFPAEVFVSPVRAPGGEVTGAVAVFNDISERLRSRRALEDERRRLEQVIAGTRAGTWQWNVQTGELIINDRWKTLLGYAADALEPVSVSTWRELGHPEDLERAEALLQRHFGGELDVYECELRMRHAHGHWVWMLARGRVIEWQADGRPLWMAGTHLDVTERRRADEARRRTEARYRALFEGISDAVFLHPFRESGFAPFVEVNEVACRWLGYSREELLGMTVADISDPEDARFFGSAEERRRLKESGRRVFEATLRNRAGERLPVEISARIFEFDGEPMDVALVRDISQRKQHETRLLQAAAVFDNTDEGIMITDVDGRITGVNEAFTRITGYPEAEVLGRRPSMLRSGHHDEAFYQAMWASLSATDHWQGEVWNRRRNGEAFPEWQTISAVRDRAGRLTHYVSVFSDISRIKQTEDELRHLAHHDPLTGLPNRMLFQERLEHALERGHCSGERVAVLYCDLDRFKAINDSFGHPAGDGVLRQVAARFRERLRPDATVARVSGDEFAVLLEAIEGPAAAERVAGELLACLRRPLEVDEIELYTTASIGIAISPNDGLAAETLLKNADAALFKAKDRGRNTFGLFHPELVETSRERVLLDSAMRRALERGEFEVHYQPLVDLADGRTVGAEALVRWRDPGRGLVSPGQFIPLAEETGLIVPLGEWVLREACRQMQHWRAAGRSLEYVSVNLAGRQLENRSLALVVEQVLEETGLPATALELEVTETGIVQDSQVVHLLRAFRELGVCLAVDDFGTGYSSLARLKDMPIDKLKVDRSFVGGIPADPSDVAITRAVIAMARNLGLAIIAEGVETATHADFLRQAGCPLGQGYFYSRPLPAGAFEDWLAGPRS